MFPKKDTSRERKTERKKERASEGGRGGVKVFVKEEKGSFLAQLGKASRQLLKRKEQWNGCCEPTDKLLRQVSSLLNLELSMRGQTIYSFIPND